MKILKKCIIVKNNLKLLKVSSEVDANKNSKAKFPLKIIYFEPFNKLKVGFVQKFKKNLLKLANLS